MVVYFLCVSYPTRSTRAFAEHALVWTTSTDILLGVIFQASEDAKRLVNQERSFACAEIESARAVVQRFGEALEEEEKLAQNSGKQVCKGFSISYMITKSFTITISEYQHLKRVALMFYNFVKSEVTELLRTNSTKRLS